MKNRDLDSVRKDLDEAIRKISPGPKAYDDYSRLLREWAEFKHNPQGLNPDQSTRDRWGYHRAQLMRDVKKLEPNDDLTRLLETYETFVSYDTTEKELLHRIYSGEQVGDELIDRLEKLDLELTAARYFPRRRHLTRSNLGDVAYWARQLQARFPKFGYESPDPERIMSLIIAAENLEIPFLRSRPSPHPSPWEDRLRAPSFRAVDYELLREGQQWHRQFEGPFQYPAYPAYFPYSPDALYVHGLGDSDPTLLEEDPPGRQVVEPFWIGFLEDWPEYSQLQDFGTSMRFTMLTILPIDEAQERAFSVASEAELFPADEWDYFGVNHYKLTHYRSLHVVFTKTGQPSQSWSTGLVTCLREVFDNGATTISVVDATENLPNSPELGVRNLLEIGPSGTRIQGPGTLWIHENFTYSLVSNPVFFAPYVSAIELFGQLFPLRWGIYNIHRPFSLVG